MVKLDKKRRRAYVLDTNVLIHDPASIYKFQEHSLLLPMTVLEELDRLKTGGSDVARAARQATRTLGALLDGVAQRDVAEGVPIPGAGRLYFLLPDAGDGLGPADPCADNRIIHEAQRAQVERTGETVVLVSKDVNLRVKCAAVGLPAEDYQSDRQVDDIDAMIDGVACLEPGFWERTAPEVDSWQDAGRVFYRLTGDVVRDWHPGMLVAEEQSGGFAAMVRDIEGRSAVLELLLDHRSDSHTVWGVRPNDRRQSFALKLLLDPAIDLVTLAGPAGTGKTFLALAAAFHQIYDERRFERVVVTREMTAMGEAIGYLPGSEEEKMEPWMGGIHDNLETLLRGDGGWTSGATQELLANRLQLRALSLMRGRTFNDTLLIIDEAQNLSPKQIKGLITRAGRNTKIVCLGNVAQIDSPYLTETTCGLTYLVQRFRHWSHAGHVTLIDVARSRLALEAEQVL